MTQEDREFAIERIKEELTDIQKRLLLKLDNTPSEDLKDFSEELQLDGIRFCEKCGKPFYAGIIWDSTAYCCVECAGLTEEEYNAQYSDEDCDCAFYTEWEI